MDRFTEAGLAGRLAQSVMDGSYISIPCYISGDGSISDRRKVFPTAVYQNKNGNFVCEAFVQKHDKQFVQRTIRVNRMHPVTLIVRGRLKTVYFFQDRLQ